MKIVMKVVLAAVAFAGIISLDGIAGDTAAATSQHHWNLKVKRDWLSGRLNGVLVSGDGLPTVRIDKENFNNGGMSAGSGAIINQGAKRAVSISGEGPDLSIKSQDGEMSLERYSMVGANVPDSFVIETPANRYLVVSVSKTAVKLQQRSSAKPGNVTLAIEKGGTFSLSGGTPDELQAMSLFMLSCAWDTLNGKAPREYFSGLYENKFDPAKYAQQEIRDVQDEAKSIGDGQLSESSKDFNMLNQPSRFTIRSIFGFGNVEVNNGEADPDAVERVFTCSHGGSHPISPKLIKLIGAIAAHTSRNGGNDVTVILLSGYRNPQFNRSVPGAKSNSFHTKGMAADIRIQGVTPSAVFKSCVGLKAGGCGNYNDDGFTHVDVGHWRTPW